MGRLPLRGPDAGRPSYLTPRQALTGACAGDRARAEELRLGLADADETGLGVHDAGHVEDEERRVACPCRSGFA